MLTLVRPQISPDADNIEQRLKRILAAYNVMYKEVSAIPYLIEAGNVFSGHGINQFLERLEKEHTNRSGAREVEFD